MTTQHINFTKGIINSTWKEDYITPFWHKRDKENETKSQNRKLKNSSLTLQKLAKEQKNNI